MTYISMHMCTNNAKNFAGLIKNLEETAKSPKEIEILVKIDDDDTPTLKEVERINNQTPIVIKPFMRPGLGYFMLWDDLNYISKFRSAKAKFICNPNDEIRYQTLHWDEALKKYENLFEDGIFRLRVSQFRYRNYNDIWEPGFAPDSYAFYSKKWFDIVEDWNPCHGPDAFQQYVAYYLSRINMPAQEQFHRDVPIHEIQIEGQGVFEGLTDDQLRLRIANGWRAWDKLLSRDTQQEAKRRAALLSCHIEKEKYGADQNNHLFVMDIKSSGIAAIKNKSDQIVFSRKYALRKLPFVLLRIRRYANQGYYCGGNSRIKHPFIKGFILSFLTRRCVDITKLSKMKRSMQKQLHTFIANVFNLLPQLKKAATEIWDRNRIICLAQKLYLVLYALFKIPSSELHELYKKRRHWDKYGDKKAGYMKAPKIETKAPVTGEKLRKKA